MSLQRLVVVSCDGLDGDARDFRDADCHRSLEEPFLTVGDALQCLREFKWRVVNALFLEFNRAAGRPPTADEAAKIRCRVRGEGEAT